MRDGKFWRLAMVLIASTGAACASSTGTAPQNGSGGVTAATASGGGGGSEPAGTGSGGSATGGAGTGSGGVAPVATSGGSSGSTGGAVSSGGAPGAAGGMPGGAGDGAAGGAPASSGGAGGIDPGTPAAGGKVLIFTNSTGYRHASIEAEAEAIRMALAQQGFTPEVSADPARFTTAALGQLRGIVLVSTTGKPLGDPGTEALAALDAFVQGGGALVGIHAASSTFYDPTGPYTRLIGGKFVNHPGSVRQATCWPEGTHPSVAQLPMSFQTTDEIYVFSNFRADNQIVLRCSALTGTDKLPIAWFRAEGKGRVFNSALGHTANDFAPTDLLMRAHFLPGMLWALGR